VNTDSRTCASLAVGFLPHICDIIRASRRRLCSTVRFYIQDLSKPAPICLRI